MRGGVRGVEVDSPVLCGAGFQPAAGLQPAFAALADARGRPVGNRPQVENLPHKGTRGLAHRYSRIPAVLRENRLHAPFGVAHPARRVPTVLPAPQCHNGNLIQVRALTKSLDTRTRRVDILRGIDLDIPSGQIVAIMGPSGSGKTTLLGLLAGLDSPSSGQVLLDGEDIARLSEDRMAVLRGRKIGFVFQSYHLIPTLTAEENVRLPMELAGEEPGDAARARDLLRRVGLEDRSGHLPVELSGGEQQRVALARAFARRPSILLADEPTGNLDSASGRMVLDLLLELNREQGATLVLVTHESAVAQCAGRRVLLRDGLIAAE